MISITDILENVSTRQPFQIKGTVSSDLKGQNIFVTVDRLFQTSSGVVADDGSWLVNFVFNSAGVRRLSIEIGSESKNVNITVVVPAPRLRFTTFPSSVHAGEPFELAGEADDFENGDELLIIVDDQFEVARPIVQSGQWHTTLIFHQSGMRDVELIASEQERIQKALDVVAGDIEIIPRSDWGAPPSPSLPTLNPKRITIHHTVFPTLSPSTSRATERRRMRDIRNSEMRPPQNFSDIGYHYVIMPSV